MSGLSPQLRIGIKRVIGVTLIALGIVGLILPFIPGIPILFVGLELLGLGLVVRSSVERALRRAGIEEMPHRRWLGLRKPRIHEVGDAEKIDKPPTDTV